MVKVFKVDIVSQSKFSQHYANFDCVHHELFIEIEEASMSEKANRVVGTPQCRDGTFP